MNNAEKNSRVRIENALVEVMCAVGERNEDGVVSLTSHTHGYAELFAVLHGSIAINNYVTLHVGDVALVPKNVVHHKTNESDDAVFYTVCISLTRYGKYQNEDVYSSLLGVLTGNEIKLYTDKLLLCRCISELNARKTAEVCKLIGYLLEEADKTQAADKSDFYDISLIIKLETIIYNEFMNDISVSYVSKKLGISARQLSRIMIKRYGSSLHRTVIKRRIDTAKEMLKGSNAPVSEIAAAVGFKNEKSLFVSFKNAEGITPCEYRRKSKTEEK